MRFSQRIGKTNVRDSLQVESIDSRLRNQLWNTILNNFFSEISNNTSVVRRTSYRGEACQHIWNEYYGNLADDIPSYRGGGVLIPTVINYFKEKFLPSAWYEKYDLIEFISELTGTFGTSFIESCNSVLRKELAGYRIIDNKIVQITAEEEIVEIEQALQNSSKWKPVQTHSKAALEYFADRDNPDYRNSIKESISAVESLCIIITGDKDTTLGKALNKVEKKLKIHGALKSAFSSLYGYTSDAGGIRHGLLEDDINVTAEDAKFMLVSCAAFINYLIVRIEE